jgi:Ser/Thr protein kinase RdoA (MazF antagonist)
MGEGMRLLSYLAKFHAINWGLQVEGLWEEGCFWQLGTRMDELNYLDRSWKRYGLDRDMAVRIHELVRRLPHRTIVHGDAKAANFFWFKDDSTIGGYDLQYCGMASPMRDIAYMLGCSMQEHLIEEYEETLLRHYHTQLMSHLSTEHAADFTFEVMQSAYDLCVCDLVRFMCGSRWWGNTDYLERKAKTWLSNNG